AYTPTWSFMWKTTTRRFCRSSVCCSQRTRVDLPAPSRPENVISIGSPRQVVVPEPQLEGQEREHPLIQPAATDRAAPAPLIGAGVPERVEPAAHQRIVHHTAAAGSRREQHIVEGRVNLWADHHVPRDREPVLRVARHLPRQPVAPPRAE